MNQGRRLLQWAHQRDYSIEWLAQQLGYSHETLSRALNKDRISQRLADALQKRFGLRVYVTMHPCDKEDNNCPECS